MDDRKTIKNTLSLSKVSIKENRFSMANRNLNEKPKPKTLQNLEENKPVA
jgi:hypothetical protein